MQSLFITGAGGYVGRRLLARLDPGHFERVVALVHPSASGAAWLRGAECVTGDLLEPASYEAALRGCDTVVHLAALTGKARPADYFRVNAEGTRTLVEACRRSGVRHLLHTSTIAVKFPDKTRYFYAHSKGRAEATVAGSELAHTIVRPTIVVGPGAPVLEGLAKLAGAPVVPIFGDGSPRVQPIFVDDLVDCLLAIVEGSRFRGEVIELGGPETLSIEALLQRIRRVRFGKAPRAVHLPLRPLRLLIGLLERPLLPWMPLTAGQLATFANEATIAPSDFVATRHPDMRDLDRALDAPPPAAGAADPELARECAVFSRYLAGRSPDAYLLEQYAAFHATAELPASSPFDRLLLWIARLGPWGAALADSYAARFHRRATLRRKLVVALALLECSPASYARIDVPYRGGLLPVFAKLCLRGGLELATTLLAALLLGPAHALCALVARSSREA